VESTLVAVASTRARRIAPTLCPARCEPISVAFFALAVAVAALLRLWQIELRPLHHDEGVNWVLLRLLHDHGTYVFNPGNYHGPTLYYTALPFVSLLGATEFALRSGPAIAGVVTLALFWSLRRWLGAEGTRRQRCLPQSRPGSLTSRVISSTRRSSASSPSPSW
jgi:hypothetical protein